MEVKIKESIITNCSKYSEWNKQIVSFHSENRENIDRISQEGIFEGVIFKLAPEK